jgi:SAM-dependent methyltransferase
MATLKISLERLNDNCDSAAPQPEEVTVQSPVSGLDVAQLKAEIAKTYTAVSREPQRDFIFPTGRAWAEDLGYPADLLARVPDTACDSFAGVANPFSLGELAAGEEVLDLGSGAAMDTLVASQMVGPTGSVTGIDMTPAMLERARRAATELGAGNVRFVEGQVEDLPFGDDSFDVVISNGVIDLVPDKDAVFDELFRVLRPGGRLQLADVTIQRPVSEEGRRNIDLWTG